ncbi:AAA family ATPase [Shinella sp.]|uniref:AAA family ATPase n=1 Tax=Shinella sp. TaxID=1870904 RepID=UPI00301DA242
MRLRRVRLKNGYKRFHDLTIDLGDNPARIVALVGPNGSGKSSVLDGLMYHSQGYGRLGTGGTREPTYHSMEGNPGFGSENIEIEFSEGNFASVYSPRQAIGRQNTIFSFRSPYRYNSILKIKETKATPDIRLNDYGAGDASSLDGKMEGNYRRLYALYNRYLESSDVRPSEAKAKIIGDLNHSIVKCLELEICSIGSVEDSRGTLYFKKSGHPKEFEFNVLSSGEKEVIDLLLDLYLRKDDYNDTVFLIDEPELHINTSIQRNLLIEIDRLVGENCQIWLTTHSIGFLRALQSNMKGQYQIVQFKPDFDLASQPFTLRPIATTAATWRDLFSIALDDLSNLVSPKTLVYCEGRAEPGQMGAERGLDAKVFNNIFAETRPDAMFISSGGNTELDQRSAVAISILSKVLPTVDILVLKDRDMASGKITTEADRDIYLRTNPVFHRVLRRWEIENYLYDKEVLKDYCNCENLPFDESAYDDLVTDIVNQNLKDVTGRIKSICGIVGSVNPESFKVALSMHFKIGMDVFKELEDCVFNRL